MPSLSQDWMTAAQRGFNKLQSPHRTEWLTHLLDRPHPEFRHRYFQEQQARASDLAEWAKQAGYQFDETGLVRVPYGTQYEINPLTISSQGWLCYENLFAVDGSLRTTSAKNLIVVVDYLLSSAQTSDALTTWNYTFSFADIAPPWNSCLSQTCVCDLLLRFSQLTDDADVQSVALAGLRTLCVDTEKGGLSSRDASGNLWLQEYTKSINLRYVLNGHLSCVVILARYANVLERLGLEDQLEAWHATLQAEIPNYTRPLGIDYALRHGATPMHYYPQMIHQLCELNAIAPHALYSEYARRWTKIYARRRRVRRFAKPLLALRRRLRAASL